MGHAIAWLPPEKSEVENHRRDCEIRLAMKRGAHMQRPIAETAVAGAAVIALDHSDSWGKTPKIFPVASIKRKVSGSCPGWRRATSCARSLAAAIASAALVKTEVSFSTSMPLLSQSIANADSSPKCNSAA